MKIIDLLNKIANGEDMPVKIKYKGIILYYDDEDNETNNYNATFNYYDKDGNKGLFNGWVGQYINNEVEILEEKKIPEKLNLDKDELLKNVIITAQDYVIEGKINEIIDYLKSKGE